MAKSHGMYGTPTYRCWRNMLARCLSPGTPSYKHYGGRGITVADRWRSFPAFLADMGVRPDGMSIDRINNDGNYEPGNCRWATHAEQMANKRKGKRGPTLPKDDKPKRPRGRPPATDPATERVEFRCTPAEKMKYRAAAKRDKAPLGAWLKALADRDS